MKCKLRLNRKYINKADNLCQATKRQIDAILYKTLLDTLPQKIFFKDKKSTYILCNKHYAKDLGIKASAIMGKTDYDFFPKAIAEKYAKDDRRVMRLNKLVEVEEEYIENKKKAWVHTVKVPLKDKDNKVVGLLGIFWDVTKEKLSREKKKLLWDMVSERVKELRCLYDLSGLIEKPGISSDSLLRGTLSFLCAAFECSDDVCGRIIFDGREYKTLNFRKTKQNISALIRIQKQKRGAVEVYCLKRKRASGNNIFLKEEKALLNAVGQRLGGALERMELDKQVKSLLSRIEFILGATKTGLDIVDSDFNIRYIDKEWAKIYGDPKGRKCYDYFAARKAMCPECGIPQALSTKKAVTAEQTLPKEGNRPIQVKTIPFQDDLGEWMLAEINIDITERKKLEEDLRKALDDWNNMFNAISDIVFITDRNFVIKKANFAFAESLNMDPKEVIGKKCYEVIHKLNQPFEGCPFEVVIESKLPFSRRIDDVNIGAPLFVSVSPIFDEKRDVVGSVHIARDIKKYRAEMNGLVF